MSIDHECPCYRKRASEKVGAIDSWIIHIADDKSTHFFNITNCIYYFVTQLDVTYSMYHYCDFFYLQPDILAAH